MKEDYAKYLLDKTREDYNLIVSHFSRTRNRIWEELKFILKYITPDDKVLDLGCGNGRFYRLIQQKTNDYVGIDSSEELIAEAERQHPEASFKVANALKLPFLDNFFDKVLSIAVLHHIPSKKFREKFFKEITRVIKPGGLLVLTVWNLQQNKKAKKLILKYGLLKILGLSKLDFRDIFYPWKNQKGKILAQRYIHCFTKREIRELTEGAGLKVKELKEIGEAPRANIFLVAEK